MTHIRKALLFCDVCGFEKVVNPQIDDPFCSSYQKEECDIKEWMKVEENHLCPNCASVYSKKREEMQRELDRLAGIKRI